jgi:hypothetical protein
MKHCPQCRTEYLDHIELCSDCKVPLVSDADWRAEESKAQRTRENLRDQDLEVACTVSGRVEADSLMNALRQEEIPCVLRSFEETAFDGLFVGKQGWGQIWVPAKRLDEATTLIEALRASPSPDLPDGDEHEDESVKE